MLRSKLGIEKEVVERYFSEFLNDGLNKQQADFVILVVDYIAENGFLEREQLLEFPFTQWGDLTTLFYGRIEVLKGIVEKIQELS